MTYRDRVPDATPAEFTFAPLTPAAFLDRSAAVFAERTAVVDGDVRLTYAELADRCARLTSALARAGVGRGRSGGGAVRATAT